MGTCVHCGIHVGNNGEGGDTCYACDLEVENKMLREVLEAAQTVVDRMRGSGGINPDAAEALNKLERVTANVHE